MRKPRKVNMIRALKREIAFYKRQRVPVNVVYETELNHLRLCSSFYREEVAQIPKDILSSLIVHRIAKVFEDSVTELPIETEYNEYDGVYRASLDLWVKPKIGG